MKNRGTEEGEAASSRRAIVAGHGDYPDGMVSAVEQISGRGDVFVVLSNRGLSGQDIESRLRDVTERSGIRVVFTDLPGGSATFATRRLMREMPDLVLVTGANLATLLEFVFHDEPDPMEAARIAAEKGRNALGAFGGG